MKVGAVIIGRNEGPRLEESLATVLNQIEAGCVVYVDSASSDESAEMAQESGLAAVVELDTSRSMNASRARREGLERLLVLRPETEAVLFLDGDCSLEPGFVAGAVEVLEASPEVAVVCGRRREEHSNRNVYHRLMDLEWNTPVGEALSCGGDSVMRISAVVEAGNFDPTVLAGEEPELCGRLRERGWRIRRIDAPMSVHDARIDGLRAWLRRLVRSGYGSLDVMLRGGRGGRGFIRHVISAWLWTVGWLIVTLVLGIVGGRVWGGLGAVSGVAIAGLLLAVQLTRMTAGLHKRGFPLGSAAAAAVVRWLGKWAEAWGQVKRSTAGKMTREGFLCSGAATAQPTDSSAQPSS